MNRESNVLIRASAGTGKTFQLSNRFLRLLINGASVDHILSSTFTRKAAGEILDRIVARLAEAALSPNKCAELAEHLDRDISQTDCLEHLQTLINRLHRLRIGTLDSFYAQVASSFCLELGLPPGWRIVEDLHDKDLRNEAIELVLQGENLREVTRLMQLMTKGDAERSVSELVRATVGRLYRLFCMTDRPAWQPFPKYRRLDDDQLNSVLAELMEAAIPDDSRFEKARESDYADAAAGNWEEFIRKGMPAKILSGSDEYFNKPIPVPLQKAYIKLLRQARAVIVEQLAQQTEATYDLLEQFDGVYQQLKQRDRALGFDDVTQRLSDLSQLGSVDELEFRLDGRIAHLLLDEFQDTSLAQWNALRPFASEVANDGGQQQFLWSGGQRSFFCVGDVKQAIYGWRGGAAEIFDALESQLTKLEPRSLNTSFRSAQPVIDTVNRIFENITRHNNLERMEPAVQSWAKQFEEHSTVHDSMPGYACLQTAPLAGEDESQGRVTARYAAEEVERLSKLAPGATIGVLARRNNVVGNVIYELQKLGIRASEEGGNPLTDSVAVEAVLSLLHLADHPGDRIALYHLLSTPLAEVVGLTSLNATQVATDVRISLDREGYGPCIYQWTQALAMQCNQRDLNRLNQLVEIAYSFEQQRSYRTTDFIDFVRNERVPDPTAAQVRVMTIHQAKGLQFDIVVLADLDANLIGQPDACVTGQSDPTAPIDRVSLYRNTSIQQLLPKELLQLFEQSTAKTVAEAICVLYVAVTRAVHSLHMIIAPSSAQEQTLHKSAAGLLRAALTDGEPTEAKKVIFEHGDLHWYEKVPRSQMAPVAAPEPQPLKIELAPLTGGRRSGLQRATPSSLEGGTKVDVAHLLNLGNRSAMARGTLIHAWFEQVGWLEDGPPKKAKLKRVADQLIPSGLEMDDDIDDLLDQFQDMLHKPVTSNTLSRDSYPIDSQVFSGRVRLEVQNERRFAVATKNELLSGTIDRLVLMYEGDDLVGADVIDFKTDSVSGEKQVDATVEHYRPQLEAYRLAVSKMYRLHPDRISTRLLLLNPDILRSV